MIVDGRVSRRNINKHNDGNGSFMNVSAVVEIMLSLMSVMCERWTVIPSSFI